jgi:ketosteroid isomerase-like protein
MTNPGEVVRFWRDAGPKFWFVKDETFDGRCRAFEKAHHAAAGRELNAWENDAEGALALLLLLDQIPRNIYRNSPHAFAAKARADGVPAAFTAYASESALMVSRQSITQGREAVTQRFARWPQGARLEWAPEAGRVSDRGDMGWTWGNSTLIATDGTRTTGRYISVWTRDLDGNWRFAFDAGID